MAVDLSVSPWNRLTRLAPTGTSTLMLQEAGDRYEANNDIYAAAADLWEEHLITLELPTASEVLSESTGDVSVKYASSDGAIAAARQRVAYFRNRAQVYSVAAKELNAPVDDTPPDCDSLGYDLLNGYYTPGVGYWADNTGWW